MADNNAQAETQNANAAHDTHKGSNQNDPRVNTTDNPGLQQPEAENPVSERRSRTPSPEATVSNVNNELHGNRPKVSRQGSEDHD